MIAASRRRLAGLQAVYRQRGLPGTVFSATRFLGRSVLPRRYADRLRYRSELIEGALTRPSATGLSTGQRLRLALAGYDERLYHAYGFDDGADRRAYLSEYARNCVRHVNDRGGVLEDKQVFHEHLARAGLARHLPALYGVIEDGTFRGEEDDDLRALTHREGRCVIKSARGGGGNSVYVATAGPDGVVLRGKRNEERPPEAVIPDLERAIVTAYCEQASYLDRMYPGSSNTIRVLTMNSADDGVFIPAAVQRIGTEATGVLDNFSQGGLSAEIDLESGTLSEAARIGPDHRVTWHRTHPDTGAPIAGVTIPGWDALEGAIRDLAGRLPGLRYVGWDVLVTAPGEFVVLEGNNFPDPDVIQVHRPLLTDDRVRRFFVRYDVPITPPAVADATG